MTQRDAEPASGVAGGGSAGERVPESRVQPRGPRWTWLWLVPMLALAASGALWWQASQERGLLIEIRFSRGEGLRAGDPVIFRGVEVGRVHEVKLEPGLTGVVVLAELRETGEPLAAEGTRFWIVRPEVSLRGVSGLETLLGPRYVEADRPTELSAMGPEGATPRVRFDGLDEPPRARGPAGLIVILEGERRGSVEVGSPVFYRDLRVGRVHGVRLAGDARGVEIEAWIDEGFAHLVRDNSKFWNASGIGLDLGLLGLELRAQSLEAVLSGGVAFATPTRAGERVGDGARFELAPQVDSDWLKWTPALEPVGSMGAVGPDGAGLDGSAAR